MYEFILIFIIAIISLILNGVLLYCLSYYFDVASSKDIAIKHYKQVAKYWRKIAMADIYFKG